MRMTLIAVFAALVALFLSSCATVRPAAPTTEVTIARAACFGFCPVYEIQTIGPNHVRFEGIRHTASLGVTIKQVDAGALAKIKSELDAYKPTAATAEFNCPDEVSDQARYTITWRNAQGRDVQSLTFNSGCRTEQGAVLRAILESIPARLDLEEESRQFTRRGTSRG